MKKVILIIRDGWGYNPKKKNNAIYSAATPVFDSLIKDYPNTLINASGPSVGLPKGYQGNSEVGHMTIGSGRIIFQSLERINHSIKSKEFFKNKEFNSAIANCKENKSKLHLIGLVQKQGVHSHIDHLYALLKICKQKSFHDVLIHIITDGRDAPVKNSVNYIKELERKLKKLGFGEIVSVSGRYYAMDRDKRWERTKQAYDTIIEGKSKQEFTNVILFLKQKYQENQTDEFIVPTVKKSYNGFQNNDSVIFFNFRTDRTRQLTQSIIEPKFNGFKRKRKQVYFVSMTKYYNKMNCKIAFQDEKLKNLLGEIISKNKYKQLRISETEKYAHITFFFNGQTEKPYLNEDRILISSPKVATYDLKPEMSVYKITSQLVKEIQKDKYNFIVVNLVNCDMVGHTGNLKAITKAIESVDECTGKIVNAGLEKNYSIIICADHGNAESQDKKTTTSHTTNKVPLILVDKNKPKIHSGGLKDIAPTVLDLMQIKKPKEMTGKSLIK